MMELVHQVILEYYVYIQGGGYFALFLMGLIYLWLHKERIEELKHIRTFIVIEVVICLVPICAIILLKYQTNYYNYIHLLNMLPILMTIAWAATQIVCSEQHDPRHISFHMISKKEVGYLAGVTVIVFLSGSMQFLGKTDMNITSEKIPTKVQTLLIQVDDLIQNESDLIMLAPDEVLKYTRAYSPAITLLYGRDMWELELKAYVYDTYPEVYETIHTWINPDETYINSNYMFDDTETMPTMLRMVLDSGVDILVLRQSQWNYPSFVEAYEKQNIYQYVEETEEYVILRKE